MLDGVYGMWKLALRLKGVYRFRFVNMYLPGEVSKGFPFSHPLGEKWIEKKLKKQ